MTFTVTLDLTLKDLMISVCLLPTNTCDMQCMKEIGRKMQARMVGSKGGVDFMTAFNPGCPLQNMETNYSIVSRTFTFFVELQFSGAQCIVARLQNLIFCSVFSSI